MVPDEHLFLSGSEDERRERKNRKPGRGRGRPGARASDNKTLVCHTCGYKFLTWMNLGIIQMHFSLWHDTEEVNLLAGDRDSKFEVAEPIDVSTSNEITQLLKGLNEATAEAKRATQEAHAVTKDLKRTVKESAADIKQQIHDEVSTAVAGLEGQAQEKMILTINKVVDDLAAAWREKLGI